MTRIDHVWVAQKDGHERRYTSAVPFSPEFARVLRGDGFSILRLDYEVLDSATTATVAIARAASAESREV